MQGFAPADKVLLFRQKGPKPCPPVRGPLGSFATVPNKMARELAELVLSLAKRLKQPSPRSRFGMAAKSRTKAGRHSKNKTCFQTEAWGEEILRKLNSHA